MTRPVEKRMSPVGARVGEGARVKRRIGKWLWRATSLVAFGVSAACVFILPFPGDAISLVANCLITLLILFGADR